MMRSIAGNFAAFSGGALLVGAVWLGLGNTQSAPSLSGEIAQRVPVPPWVRADCPEEARVSVALEKLAEELEEKWLQLSIARAQEEVFTGKPLEWPGDVDDRLQEAAVTAFLEASTAQSNGTILGIDCGEFPCVASIAWREEDEKRGRDHISGEYRVRGNTGSWRLNQTEGDGYFVTWAFVPGRRLSEEENARVFFRIRESLGIFPLPEDW